ncbi:MAG: response regulator [Bacteroidales bacterium]|nr:response regulator [Bacteroidales bacterium]MCF8403208.1 response regulator [Bacteroidales bacterium]
MKRVFLAEDDLDIANWIRKQINTLENINLIGFNYKIEGTYDMILQESPDIVILDLRFPDGNGIDILKKIRKENKDMKVIIFTMNAQAKNYSLRNGADYFFDKSTETEKFMQKLSELSKN